MSITKLNNLSISAVTALPSGVGGKVLQVVNADTGTQVNTTSTSFIDTNLTASITPSSTSNKILVIINQSCAKNDSDTWCTFQILRGATQIGGNPSGESIGYTSNSEYNFMGMTYNVNFLDTPSTTSSVTYKTQFKTQALNGARVQPDGCKSFITLIEIAG